MGVVWNKVWYDLWHDKVRTLLVILSIAAGVFAIGAMFGMADLLLSSMDRAHQAVIPAHVKMTLTRPIDRDMITSLKHIPGVEGAQPINEVTIQYKLHPQDPWKQGVVYMLDDFNRQSYEIIQLNEGRWPKRDDVGIERLAAQYLSLGVGDRVIFKFGDSEREFPISGRIRHPFVPPLQFEDLAYFIMNAEGLERFGIPAGKFNELLLRVRPYSSDHVKEVAAAVKDRLGKEGVGIASTLYPDPDRHWGRQYVEAFTVVLQMLAVVTLGMSVILVYNTLSGLIAQQTNQIGIIKAIGGKSGAIIRVYLMLVLVYGLVALLIAVPLGAGLAFVSTRLFLSLFNIDYDQFQVSTTAVALQMLAAVAVPVLAGWLPTMHGAGITVQAAIASYGLGGGPGPRRLDSLVERIGAWSLPSHYANSFANLFRRKGRLLLTELVLLAAGTMFLTVMSLSASIRSTEDRVFALRQFDVTFRFSGDQRLDRVAEVANSITGVDKAEVRFTHSAALLNDGQQVKEAGVGTVVEGISAGSDLFRPVMLSGRWLERGDRRALVIAKKTADKSGLRVTSMVTLDLGEFGKKDWQIVGIYDPVFTGGFLPDTLYAPQDALLDAANTYNRGNALVVRTNAHGEPAVAAITSELKNAYETRKMNLAFTQTEFDVRRNYDFQFGIVVSFLLGLAIMIALVGGIALTGALSLGVVERTKEIGVLRAIGARSRTILGMMVLEGVMQALLSWVLAVPLAFFVARPMADLLGKVMLNANLDYTFDIPAVGIWLLLVVAIAVLASAVPARSASRISVRDSLAYA